MDYYVWDCIVYSRELFILYSFNALAMAAPFIMLQARKASCHPQWLTPNDELSGNSLIT